MKGRSNLSCRGDSNRWIRACYAQYQECVQRHHWKILLAGLAFLGLCCLGFKSMDFERDIVKLWIYNSSNLNSETSFISQQSSNQIDRGSTETILQMSEGNILSVPFLLEHAQLLELIVKLKVIYNGRVFTLQHFCRQIQLPKMHYVDYSIQSDIENMMPCQIATPLNCFWEGSKLLNNDHRISTSSGDNYQSIKIDWRTFDLQVFLGAFKDTLYEYFFIELFNETGIGRGYVSLPCLDVTDPLCPHKDRTTLDIDRTLQSGCYQIAKNLYNYPKSVFVGDSNHGIQSLIYLRSAADVFQTMRSNDLDWSEDNVQHVMDLWQSKLRQAVILFNKQRPYLESILYRNVPFQSKRVDKSSFYVFTNNSLSTALSESINDRTMLARYLVAGGLLTLFLATIFLASDNPVRSHCWLAITGVLLLSAAIVAGLGLSAAIGLKFSLLTTHVIPYLMLGMGLDDILVLAGRYSRCLDDRLVPNAVVHPVRETLFDSASLILLSFLVKLSLIGALAMVPVPLMRNFCIQIILITVFQTGTSAFLYPCLLYLDSERQRHNRIDVLCCFLKTTRSDPPMGDPERCAAVLPTMPALSSSQIIFSTQFSTSPDTLIPDNVRQYVEINPAGGTLPPPPPSRTSYHPTNPHTTIYVPRNNSSSCSWTFRYRVSKTFVQIIALMPVQITVVMLTVVIAVLGLYSAVCVDCGLRLESIFFHGSNEYLYVKYESQEFHMDTFDVVTKEVDYVNYQDLVLQLNEEVKGVPEVQVAGNGKFWLQAFIDWLESLQRDLDLDLRRRLIFPNGTWLANASRNGLLAMTLLVQDQDDLNYKKLGSHRLVQSRHVDPSNFYVYLNAWRSASIEYDTLPCVLYPQIAPFNIETFVPNSHRFRPLVIRVSGKNLFHNNPLQFVSCKYFHRGVHEKDELSLVKTIRTITSKFTDKGISAIPLGQIFSLSEQYFNLRHQVMFAGIVTLVCVFLAGLLILGHLPPAIIICLLLSSSVLGPFYFLSAYQLPLNATSGVMVLLSGGMGVRLSLFVMVTYCEQSRPQGAETTSATDTLRCYPTIAVGKNIQNRMRKAISHSPCGSVMLGTLLSGAFISMTNIAYIREHFLLLPLVGLIHSLFNCYCMAPVLCFYLLPDSPLLSHTVRASRPQTSASTSRTRSQRSWNKLHINKDNLSTIPEESSSLKSSTKSQTSQDPKLCDNSTPSTQEQINYIEQNVQSTLTLQHPHIPELALKTSFTYRQPLTTDK